MTNTTTIRTIALGAFAGLVSLAAQPALANTYVDTSHPAFANVSFQTTSIPVGAADFCSNRSGECGPNANVVQATELTDARWSELLEVNSHFNTTVTPVTDQEYYGVSEFWTYPDAGYGDCEDFALAKRRALIQQGWSPSTLMIAVVRQQNGEGHAVLMVRTDRGDLVLDNQESMIKVWTDTPYHFIKRQSQANSAQWVDIYDERPIVIAASR